MAGSLAVLLYRQVIPPASLIRAETLAACPIIELMLGRVPSKPEYLLCHGSVSLRIVATPDAHGPSMALVMYPTSDPITFGAVLEWKDPSRVS